MSTEYEITKETYDKIAERYAILHDKNDVKEKNKAYEIMERLVPKQSMILDAGCGPGRESKHFLDVGYNVMSIDVSDGMIEEARKRVPEGDFQKMNMMELEFRAEYFDGIWVAASLLHVRKEDAGKALQEFNRVLKTGGIIFISVKEGENSEMKIYPDGSKRFFVYYKMDELKQEVEKNGFSTLESYKFKDKDGDIWLCLFAKKNS